MFSFRKVFERILIYFYNAVFYGYSIRCLSVYKYGFGVAVIIKYKRAVVAFCPLAASLRVDFGLKLFYNRIVGFSIRSFRCFRQTAFRRLDISNVSLHHHFSP